MRCLAVLLWEASPLDLNEKNAAKYLKLRQHKNK
jgi:hypothetical protein